MNTEVQSVKITVLMCVYNAEQWLGECIRSILSQSYSNFEFIIINDGSTDNSLKILNKFAVEDNRVKIFTKSNTGLTSSLNYGIERATGSWIARIDADDISTKHRLRDQLKETCQRKNIVLVGSGLTFIDGSGVTQNSYIYPNQTTRLRRRIKSGKAFFPHSSAFINTQTLRSIGGYREAFKRSQDLDLWLRLIEVGDVACITKPLVKIRRHDNQLSSLNFGVDQIIYSHIALTSSYLRTWGEYDPAQLKHSNLFDTFYEFVKNEVKPTIDELQTVQHIERYIKTNSQISKDYYAKIKLFLIKLIIKLKREIRIKPKSKDIAIKWVRQQRLSNEI